MNQKNLITILLLSFSLTVFSQNTKKDDITTFNPTQDNVYEQGPITLKFLKSQVINNEYYEVILILTNSGHDKKIVLQPDEVTLIDGEGNGYQCEDILVGKDKMEWGVKWGKSVSSKLYQDIPTKVILTYPYTDDISKIALCAIEMIEEKEKSEKFNMTLKLMNIELKKE